MDILRENLDQEFVADANRLYRGMDEREMRTAHVWQSIGSEDEPGQPWGSHTVEVSQLPSGLWRRKETTLHIDSEYAPYDPSDGQPDVYKMSREVAVLYYDKHAVLKGIRAGVSRSTPGIFGRAAVAMDPDRYRSPRELAGFYAGKLVVEGLRAIEASKK
jgi:hypothetical protein